MENNIVDEEISIDNIDSMFDSTPSNEEETIKKELDNIGEDSIEPEKETEEKAPEAEEKTTEEKVEATEPEADKAPNKEPKANSRVKELIELGLLDDVKVSLSEEDTEGTLISEQTDLTEAQIKHILKLQGEKKEANIKDGYIPKENLSEQHLKIIEIMRNGGDISKVFQDPNEAVKRPFEGRDLSDINVQREVATTYYMGQKGLSKEESLDLVAKKEKNFTLDTFTEDIVDAYGKAYDSYLDNVKETKIKEREEYSRSLQQKRKDLTEVFKQREINPKVYNKIVDGVTKPLSDGTFEVYKVLERALENPKENIELLMHLLDSESYQKLNKIKGQENTTGEVIRLFDGMPKDRAKQKEEERKEFKSEIEEELASISFTK